MQQLSGKNAFTLIELLIVVAIIAILAAIAVPNFLEAQVRAKVSRVKSDLRTTATGLESYRIDYNAYPSGNDSQFSLARSADFGRNEGARVLERLSTPVAYLTTGALSDSFDTKAMIDPNKTTGDGSAVVIAPADLPLLKFYKYTAFTPGDGVGVTALVTNNLAGKYAWALWSAGPSGQTVRLRGSGFLASSAFSVASDGAILSWAYDPTNGTVSRGNVFRTGGVVTGGDEAAGGKWLRLMLPITSR